MRGEGGYRYVDRVLYIRNQYVIQSLGYVGITNTVIPPPKSVIMSNHLFSHLRYRSPYVVLRLQSRCLCFVPPWAEPFPCVLHRAPYVQSTCYPRRRRRVIAGGERSLELGSTTCTGKENIRAHVRVRTPGVVCSERNLLLTSKAISK